MRWWWSPTILGGHIPYELLHELERKLGLGFSALTPLNGLSDPRAAELAKAIEEQAPRFEEIVATFALIEGEVAWQVGATVLMGLGAEISPAFRQRALQAGREDRWALSSGERAIEIEAYLEALESYRALQRRRLAEESLLEAAARLGPSASGLPNQ